MILESIDLASLSLSLLSAGSLPLHPFPLLFRSRDKILLFLPRGEERRDRGRGNRNRNEQLSPRQTRVSRKKKPIFRRNRLFVGKCPVSLLHGKSTIFISVLSMSSSASVSDTLTTKRREGGLQQYRPPPFPSLASGGAPWVRHWHRSGERGEGRGSGADSIKIAPRLPRPPPAKRKRQN